MSESIYDLNRKLIDVYGRHIETGEPNYRIVRTTNQLEKRYEEYNVYSETGSIFLRTEKGVFEVPKYPEEYKDMWVLERLLPTVGNPYLEMVTKFSYEPIWIFGAANSDRTPIWRAIELLVRNNREGDPNRVNMSPSDLAAEEQKRIDKEKVLFKEMLAGDDPIIAKIVHSGEGVFLDHPNFAKEKDNASS